MKSLQSFLGLASYYQRFVPNFSVIANPLFALTRKDAAFNWNESCQQAFDQLRMYLTTVPVLVYPDFSIDFKRVQMPQEWAWELCYPRPRRMVAPDPLPVRVGPFSLVEITDHEALKSLLSSPHPFWEARELGIDPARIGSQQHLPPREEESQGRCPIQLPSSPGPSR